MARLHPTSIQLPRLDLGDGDFLKGAHHLAFAEYQSKSNKIDLDDRNVDLTGAVIDFQIADGYASYVVVTDNGGNDIRIRHINYMDGYSIPAAHVRGLLRSDILANLRDHRKWSGQG